MPYRETVICRQDKDTGEEANFTVSVHYSASPREPCVGWDGGVEVDPMAEVVLTAEEVERIREEIEKGASDE